MTAWPCPVRLAKWAGSCRLRLNISMRLWAWIYLGPARPMNIHTPTWILFVPAANTLFQLLLNLGPLVQISYCRFLWKKEKEKRNRPLNHIICCYNSSEKNCLILYIIVFAFNLNCFLSILTFSKTHIFSKVQLKNQIVYTLQFWMHTPLLFS